MAFSRRRFRGPRRGGFRRRRRGFGFGSAVKVARAAWRGVKYLRGLVNSELYKADFSFAGQAFGSNATFITHLTGIAQGDGITTRTGNSIYVRSINVKGSLTWNSASGAGQLCRVSLIMDKQQISDTTPNFTDVYTNGLPFSHLNPNTVGRFSVLWSKSFQVSATRPDVPLFLNKAMRHHVRYNGTTSTDIQRGAIYLLVTSDATVNYPTLNMESRTSYHDN